MRSIATSIRNTFVPGTVPWFDECLWTSYSESPVPVRVGCENYW